MEEIIMRQRHTRELRILIALLILIGGGGLIIGNLRAAPARAATPNLAFLPITLADPGAAELTGGGYINEIQVSGNWVRYRRDQHTQPWFNPIPGPNIELVNTLTGRQVII